MEYVEYGWNTAEYRPLGGHLEYVENVFRQYGWQPHIQGRGAHLFFSFTARLLRYALGGFLEVSLLRGSEDSSLPSGPVAFGHHALSHANTRAAGASHALLHAHRVKTARTSPRARKHAQRQF